MGAELEVLYKLSKKITQNLVSEHMYLILIIILKC